MSCEFKKNCPDIESVTSELINLQKIFENKTEQWSNREYELCSKIAEQNAQIQKANKIVEKLSKMRFTTDKIILISQLRSALNANHLSKEGEK
jgi:phosphoheptose isomerase